MIQNPIWIMDVSETLVHHDTHPPAGNDALGIQYRDA